MSKPKVAVIVGSNRKASINRKLAEALVKLEANKMEAVFIKIDDLPMYNADLEENRPAVVNHFTQQVANTDAILIVTPEHNRSIPAVLKNAIDWGSKPADKNVWKGKVAAVAGTSPGAMGTALGQQHLRHLLSILGSLVVGGEAYLTYKEGLIDDNHEITKDDTKKFLQTYLNNFLNIVALVKHK